MDASQRAALEATLADAVNKRDELNVVINYLSAQLGQPPPSGGSPGGGGLPVTSATQPGSGTTPVGAVAEGEFYGTSATKATATLMERMGRNRPLKTGEIYAAIKKGGVQIKNQDGLYRALHRDDRFQRVGSSLWGLSAWYPKPPKEVKVEQLHPGEVKAALDGESEKPENEAS